jgi:sec-independent protein translocase protein TatC
MPARPPADDQDPFAATRMTFGEHIEDLRWHLLRAIGGFLVALLVSFFIGPAVLRFISAPVEAQLFAFYEQRVRNVEKELNAGDPHSTELNTPAEVRISMDRKELERQLGIKSDPKAALPDRIEIPARIEEPLRFAIALHKAQQYIGRRPALSTLSVQEAFMAYLKVSFACGLVLGSPWIFYQLWLFVAAGLYPAEKRVIHVYLPVSILLFLAGVLMCQFWVIPKAIEALLWFNQWMGLEPDLRFNEWLGFAIIMPLIFGLSFQLPLVMMALERVGIFTVQDYTSKWKIACFLIHVFAMVAVPTADAISMECLAIPMFGLYCLGILLCRFNPARTTRRPDVPDSNELVEV